MFAEAGGELLVEYVRHGRNVLLNNLDSRRLEWLEGARRAAR